MEGTNQSDIDRLDIVIRPGDGKVIAGIPQIALYATADSAPAALEALERKKNLLKDDIAAAGVAGPLPVAAAAGDVSSTGSIGRFAIKSAIVAVMIMAVLAASGALLANRIESVARGIVSADLRGGRQVWIKLEDNLARMADPSNEMSEERKQKLLSNIRTIVARLRPFVAEVMPLFAPVPASR